MVVELQPSSKEIRWRLELHNRRRIPYFNLSQGHFPFMLSSSLSLVLSPLVIFCVAIVPFHFQTKIQPSQLVIGDCSCFGTVCIFVLLFIFVFLWLSLIPFLLGVVFGHFVVFILAWLRSSCVGVVSSCIGAV